jgi:hypothetical protein
MTDLPDPAAMRAAYEAGSSILQVGKAFGVGYRRARQMLIDAGTAIRPPAGESRDTTMSSTERASRVLEVLKFMIRGVDRHAIHTHCNDVLGWGVAPRTIDEYMMNARAELKARYAAEVDTLAAMADARDDYARQRALAVDDVKTFHAVNTEANKRHGLYAPAKTELSGKDGAQIVLYLPDNGRLQRPAE